MGLLAIGFGAIPLALAITLFIVKQADISHRGNYYVSAAVAISLLFPFYFFVAYADWENTFYDLPPQKLTSTIPLGFGAGIKTNPLYADLARWIEKSAATYSSDGDFALVTEYFPMAYILAKRRPSLNHSWTGFTQSESLRRDSVEAMLRNNRQPKIAFRFLFAPMFFQVAAPGSGQPQYSLGGNLSFPKDDAINQYILTKMHYVDAYQFGGQTIVEVYVQ